MRLTNLEKSYISGDSNLCCALNKVNIEFDNKGLVFILGKSGSGKSTLLNLLAGLDKPSSGSIEDDSLCITKLSSTELNTYRKNNIGFIFQNYNLIYELNVMENILLNTKQTEEQIKSAEEYLDRFNLLHYRDKNVNELSGGEQQRVAIVRALFKNSKIILADEPTGNLDTNNSEIIYDCLKEIAKQRLVIVVSHDKENAYKYGDRVITLSDGEVIGDTKEDTKEKPVKIDVIDKKDLLPTHTASKLAKKFMRAKKLKLYLGAILVAFTLSLLGLLIVVFNYNFNNISTSVFQKNNTELVGVGRGYTDKNSGKFVLSFRVIDEDSIQSLRDRIEHDDLDGKFMLHGMIISPDATGSSFLPSYARFAIESSEEGLKKYNFSMESGEYPIKSEEIAITDYLAYCISVLNPKVITEILGLNSMQDINDDNLLTKGIKKLDEKTLIRLFTSDWETEITKRETLDKIRDNPGLLLLDQTVDFTSCKLKISGIIETDFESKYKDIIYMDWDQLREDPRTEEFGYLYENFLCNFYVSEDFLANVYKDIIIFNDCVYLKYSSYKDQLQIDKELTGTNTYISSNYFRDYFQSEFFVETEETYTMPNQVYIPLGKGMEKDVIYENDDFVIAGVFEIPMNYSEQLHSSKVVVVSDEFFEEFSKAQTYCSFVYTTLPREESKQKEYLEFLKKNDLYYITVSSKSLYQLTDILGIFRDVFKIISIIIALFTALFITNYFTSLVMDKKREIGIMRALGMSKRDINKIFIMCGVRMTCITVLISYLLFTIFIYVSNKLLINSYLHYIDKEVIKGLTILQLNIYPYLAIPVFCLCLLGLSIMFPISRISKLNTINAIKGE